MNYRMDHRNDQHLLDLNERMVQLTYEIRKWNRL